MSLDKHIYLDYGIDLRADALAAIGAISISWERVLAALEAMIWTMARMNNGHEVGLEASIITTRLNTHDRILALKALAKLPAFRKSSFPKNLDKYTEQVRRLAKQRNKLIHAYDWYVDGSVSPEVVYSINVGLDNKDGFRSKNNKFDKNTYESLITRLHNCSKDGWILIHKAEQLINDHDKQ